MAKPIRKPIFVGLLVLAAAILAGIFYTAGEQRPQGSRGKRSPMAELARLVDQRPLATARELARTATNRGEGRLSREAVRLADQELDLAFETAMREAQQHPAAATPETKQIREHIKEVEAEVKSDQQQVDRAKAAASSRKDVEAAQAEVALAQAQLTLHSEELEDSKQDLLRGAADPYSRIQRLLAQHEAAEHAEAEPAVGKLPEFQAPGSMLAQVRTVLALRDKQQKLLDAQQQALDSAQDLAGKHDQLESQLKQDTAGTPAAGTEPQGALAHLHQLADDRKGLAEYDKRIQAKQQLAQDYSEWATLIGGQVRQTVHAVLKSLLWIVLIILLVMVVSMLVERAYNRLTSDRRRIATMRMLMQFVLRGVGALLILFVLLGPPGQLSTVLALAGAGLTVALKDFIVAFFGWFALMGKNGIRVGDWVEINGIGGEVVEIGLLRTVLLETGNWADSGHPTGRRVTFTNSFAIEGHFFNFSTSGQWLWDTLEVLVPAGRDPYPISEAILQVVVKETEADARKAEQEWQRATHDHGVRSLAATPGIDIRPTALGVNIIIRYITQASARYEVRARLYQAVVDLLHRKNITGAQPVPPDVLTADTGQ